MASAPWRGRRRARAAAAAGSGRRGRPSSAAGRSARRRCSAASRNASPGSSQTRYSRAAASRSCTRQSVAGLRIARGLPGSAQSADVIVVGGGVIGLAVAWRAARAGLAVTLLERGRAGGGTTHHAAGMLAPVSEADPSEPALLELGIASARALSGLRRRAAGRHAARPRVPRLRHAARGPRRRRGGGARARAGAARRLGLEAERLLPSRARRLEPALVPSLRLAAELPERSRGRPPGAVRRARRRAHARRRGRCARAPRSIALRARRGAVAGVRLRDGEVLPRPAGRASPPGRGAARSPGCRTTVRCARSRARSSACATRRGPGLVERVLRAEGVYLVPRGDGRYVLGATMEERGFDRTVTAGGVFELLRELLGARARASSELVLEELSAGLRPATPDNAPVIGAGRARRVSCGRRATIVAACCSPPSPPSSCASCSERRRSAGALLRRPLPAGVRA